MFFRLIAAILLLLAAPLHAQTPEADLGATITRLETDLEARIGIQILDTATGWSWGHRQDERFLMASTFKSVLCGGILQGVDRGEISLEESVRIGAQVPRNSPVTSRYLGGSLSIARLCLATLDQSDNGAANLLIDRMGGTQAVTAFLRGIGDSVTRLDRKEPEMNLFLPGDPRDTTSPAAMVASWQVLLTGDALAPASRAQLIEWMSIGGVTGTLLRPSVPPGWQVADRSGGGRDHTRNIVAMLTPPGRAPFFVAIYLSDTPANWSTRNAAVAELSAKAVALLETRVTD
ncbi:class A beta-lactamase [Gemmobacter serpentinus]|uniref:class A beta-lactamase n=1 Tax=Gemmobacter serpentinus TaxID=2652247 RepID=UPI00124CB56A|nr:class A beta-lactamase [Gemmobacter serpentinus]